MSEVGSNVPRISVVVATYNRGELLVDLLRQLAKQTLPTRDFEVIVVDDGSREDPTARIEALRSPLRLTLIRQENQGAAAARGHGVSLAQGELLVFVDDDMKVPEDFLEQHARAHEGQTSAVVLGYMKPADVLAEMPCFERFHARLLDRMVDEFRAGTPPRGSQLFTGNVSMRRADYLAVGGFDRTLAQSEDAELGIRLERHGARFSFSEAAYSVHHSDHVSLEKWLTRAFRYGIFDLRIARKHADFPDASPWRFLPRINRFSRPFLALAIVAPPVSKTVAKTVIFAAVASDKVGLERLSLLGTSLVYAMEYYRGVRDEEGGLLPALRSYRRFRNSAP